MRNLYEVLCASDFKRVTYGMYNKLDDERFFDFIETKYGIDNDIDNYHYTDIKLTDEEQQLDRALVKSMIDNFTSKLDRLEQSDAIKCYVNTEIGLIRVIKPLKVKIG